jgi:hypothetical protein
VRQAEGHGVGSDPRWLNDRKQRIDTNLSSEPVSGPSAGRLRSGVQDLHDVLPQVVLVGGATCKKQNSPASILRLGIIIDMTL